MNKEQQNQLDALRRAIRELSDENIIVTYDGSPLITVGTVHDLKALEAELTWVEVENHDLQTKLDESRLMVDRRNDAANRLTERVEKYEAVLKQVVYYASEHDETCTCDTCSIYRLAETFNESESKEAEDLK